MYGNQQNYAGEKSAGGTAFGNAAGYASDAAAPGRQAEIPAVLARLDMQVQSLAEVAARLDDRLTGSIARSHSPSPVNESKGQLKAANQTGIGAHVDVMSDQLQSVRDRLTSLLDRLEI